MIYIYILSTKKNRVQKIISNSIIPLKPFAAEMYRVMLVKNFKSNKKSSSKLKNNKSVKSLDLLKLIIAPRLPIKSLRTNRSEIVHKKNKN